MAKRILNDHMVQLHELAKALLEFETIDGEHVDMIVKGGSVDDIRSKLKEIQDSMSKEQEEARKKSSEREELISTNEEEEEESGGPLGDPTLA